MLPNAPALSGPILRPGSFSFSFIFLQSSEREKVGDLDSFNIEQLERNMPADYGKVCCLKTREIRKW